ncbi:alpha/beta hydrolase [Bradyrhizobium sp. S69]|uniref:alpha/beta fold hydrolase n=1 Tax=Bradyrhizobium sp. S69 TaxID=1641856 RepID=UPI001AEECD67|nr:alpha/beta hydrolase [Bradyrhizobium sp. S69]
MFDFLQIDRAHFLGLSLGGFVGQWLGIYAPDRFERLILSNTSSYLASELPFDEQIRTVLAAKDMTAIADGSCTTGFPPRCWLDQTRSSMRFAPWC